MERAADPGKVLISPKTTVDFTEIPCIISVIVRFENRIQENRIYAQVCQIIRPVQKFADSGDGLPVVVYRSSTESDGIDLIENYYDKPT
mgnify:CR=1 FL=1